MTLSARKIKKLLVVITTILVLTILALFSLRTESKEKAIAQGISIANISLENISYNDAAVKMDKAFSSLLDEPILLELNGNVQSTPLKNLGVSFNTIKTLEEVYRTSESKNIFHQIKIIFDRLDNSIKIEPIFHIDEQQLRQEIKNIFPEISDANNAKVIIKKNLSIEITPHQEGLTINFVDIYFQIENSLKNLKVPQLNIKAIKIDPKYSEESALKDVNILTELLKQEIEFISPENALFEYISKVQIKPTWVSVKNGKISFKEGEIKRYLESLTKEINRETRYAIIKKLPDEENKWAEIDGIPKNGQILNVEKTTEQTVKNLKNNQFSAELVVDRKDGIFINQTDIDLGELELLGQGRSNFYGSPWERGFNIKKGINEKINNVVGETFSFNSYLGRVINSAGWLDALTIFAEQELKPSPGGGLCQVSTTVYRGALQAGLKMVERASHSLYVHYYKAYGDGLDATIYPGSRDLRFMNDTESYIIIQAYVEGNDVFVNFYGTPDERSVELIGPRKVHYDIEDHEGKTNPVSQRIYWIQKITRPDGEVEENNIISVYRTKS
jgi:vancomycin resistance protein YoaR